jgi:hypothetical protein
MFCSDHVSQKWLLSPSPCSPPRSRTQRPLLSLPLRKKHVPSLVGHLFFLDVCECGYMRRTCHSSVLLLWRLSVLSCLSLSFFFFFWSPCPLSVVPTSRPCHATVTDSSAPFVLGRRLISFRFHFDTVLDFRDGRPLSPFSSRKYFTLGSKSCVSPVMRCIWVLIVVLHQVLQCC